MPYVAPATVVTATTITTAWGNSVKAATDFLANPPACRVYNNVNQSIPVGGSGTFLAFNTERFDTNTMHDTVTNNGRITFNTAGLYVVSFSGSWAAVAGGIRVFELWLNGLTTKLAGWLDSPPSATDARAATITTLWKMAAGDYVQALAYQTSGGALNVVGTGNTFPEFSAVWVGLG